MRHLSLLALITLAAIPLSAHDHWRDSRRIVVVTEPRFAPCRPWEGRRWTDRWEHPGYVHRYDCGGQDFSHCPGPLTCLSRDAWNFGSAEPSRIRQLVSTSRPDPEWTEPALAT